VLGKIFFRYVAAHICRPYISLDRPALFLSGATPHAHQGARDLTWAVIFLCDELTDPWTPESPEGDAPRPSLFPTRCRTNHEASERRVRSESTVSAEKSATWQRHRL